MKTAPFVSAGVFVAVQKAHRLPPASAVKSHLVPSGETLNFIALSTRMSSEDSICLNAILSSSLGGAPRRAEKR
ncbi:MAG: hypothetical protein Q4C86_13810 [bacterium]|nr:hypothetical protein [bacterium]